MGISLTLKKIESNREGKKISGQPPKKLEVSLDGVEVEMALKLGDGDLSLGIRRAVVLASMRQFKRARRSFGEGVDTLSVAFGDPWFCSQVSSPLKKVMSNAKSKQ